MRKMLYLTLVCGLIVLTSCKSKEGQNSESDSNSVDVNQVQKEFGQAFETTGDYLSEKKGEIMEKAKEKYSQLENDTKILISDMKQAGTRSWQDMQEGLNNKLDAVKQKYNELKEANEKNLQKAGDAFNTAIDELKDAYDKTKAEFSKSE